MGLIPGSGRSLEKEMAMHCSILAWEISWTEEPGGLQSTEFQRVGHDWVHILWLSQQPKNGVLELKILKYIYSFIWLCRVLAMALEITVVRGLSLSCVGSLVTGHRLSCSSVCGIFVPWPGGQTWVPCIARQILNHWTTREVLIVKLLQTTLLKFYSINKYSDAKI